MRISGEGLGFRVGIRSTRRGELGCSHLDANVRVRVRRFRITNRGQGYD